jgi:hypothetical protein
MASVLISPYSNRLRSGAENPKNYPSKLWGQIGQWLKIKKIIIHQVGIKGEKKLGDWVHTHHVDLKLPQLAELAGDCDIWLSIDNFFPHFIHNLPNPKPGIVLFSQSDPLLYGYPENNNLLKSRRFLRVNQNGIWEQTVYDSAAYVDPAIVIKELEKRLNL